jgi:ribose-phosphate pyrophosphokinase
MDKILLVFPGNECLGRKLSEASGIPEGAFELHSFPDGESYVRIKSDVKAKKVFVLCTLPQPDEKIIPLLFLARLLREATAKEIILLAPYLAYMRQDKQFRFGEAVSSRYFAELISACFDGLITIDPHLHRIKSLSEIYSIPTEALHAAPLISAWIKEHIEMPVLIGPDEESLQWVKEVADCIQAPYLTLRKERLGDNVVKESIPDLHLYTDRHPVLLDDIISSGQTLYQAALHIREHHPCNSGLSCIGVHGIFSGMAYALLQKAGADVITTNTIPHPSNDIDIFGLLAERMIGERRTDQYHFRL